MGFTRRSSKRKDNATREETAKEIRKSLPIDPSKNRELRPDSIAGYTKRPAGDVGFGKMGTRSLKRKTGPYEARQSPPEGESKQEGD